MPIKINGSTSGSVTLAAPATGADVSLTLPTAGFGKLLQVVVATSGNASTTSTSFADTGLTATITPSLVSSRILVMMTSPFILTNGSGSAASGTQRILRDATPIFTFSDSSAYIQVPSGAGVDMRSVLSINWIDSPATTSAVVYKQQHKTVSGTTFQSNNGTGTLILAEIGA